MTGIMKRPSLRYAEIQCNAAAAYNKNIPSVDYFGISQCFNSFQSITDLSERSSRPPSRSANYRTTPPPPPPVRSSSKGAALNFVHHAAPPLPDRNYDAEEVQQNYNLPYTPSPGKVYTKDAMAISI